MNPGGGSGWDEPPLEVQIPDDARELDRDVIAYHRELRARRRRRALRRLTAPFSGQGTVMPLLASILAVCLVAGAMLSVATFSPATGPERQHQGRPSATAASGVPSAARRPSAQTTATPASAAPASATSASGAQSAQNSSSAGSTTATSATASPSAGASGTARPSGSANSSARSTPAASATYPPHPAGGP